MLKTRLLHPQVLEALGEAGHGAQVLIADGNYPLLTRSNPASHRVFLNLAPGLLTVTDVLAVLADAIPIEAAHVMGPDTGDEPGDLRGLPRAAAGDPSPAPRAVRLLRHGARPGPGPGHRHGRAAHLRQHPADHRRGDARIAHRGTRPRRATRHVTAAIPATPHPHTLRGTR